MKQKKVRRAPEETVLGIDAGSVSVGIVLCSATGELLGSFYSAHDGAPTKTLFAGLDSLCVDRTVAIGVTGSSIEAPEGAESVDSVIALLNAVGRLHGKIGGALFVGGERFGLVRFREDGSYRDLQASTSCAAGSGSFLDQQARRLGLSGPAELAALAREARGAPPDIASRCSVFAKTDIIHAQALGHSLNEICDGLCLGLARNIAETVLRTALGEIPGGSIVFAGGVALNEVLTGHLEKITGLKLLVGDFPQLYGAYGAALGACDKLKRIGSFEKPQALDANEIFKSPSPRREYYYPPLSAGEAPPRHQRLGGSKDSGAVEAALFFDPSKESTDKVIPVIAGIDIGSTSTKLALLLDETDPTPLQVHGTLSIVLLGLYTRTRGQPLQAAGDLFTEIARLSSSLGVAFRVTGLAATGSGRKFVGAVAGADLVVNEISAHARAAFEIDPEIDTIIEIGGQDSKFTIVQEGRVTFCQMNTVCAAGTGSFLEEQAIRLGVSLDDFERLAVDVSAPLTSDRCTVFMERDINACLSRGYSRREMLAASVRAVCENYLTKVATEARIGKRICFQGATARNGALVAAFRERLGREISVSEYCHLTGAVGAALCYRDERGESTAVRSRFRGIDVMSAPLHVEVEDCTYCTNRCRIRVAEIGGERVGYGFDCGREYGTTRRVPRKRSADLLRERRKLLRQFSGYGETRSTPSQPSPLEHPRGVIPGTPRKRAARADVGSPEQCPVVGLTNTLPSLEDAEFWRLFFALIGIKTVFPKTADVPAGRRLAGADFCAPMLLLHAQISELAESVEWIFAPVEVGPHPALRRMATLPIREPKYCYYTQFSSSLAGTLSMERTRLMAPVFRSTDSLSKTVSELLRVLEPFSVSRDRIRRAYSDASRALSKYRSALAASFSASFDPSNRVSVMILGRPYVVLSDAMNRGIPGYFAELGVKTYYQDMIPPDCRVSAEAQALLQRFHWIYPIEMLRAADYSAQTDGLYPVLLTTFKCSPDSFFVEYFKRILENRNKPYLILQLDDLDSSVGYESRIEAAVRSFANHRALLDARDDRKSSSRTVMSIAPSVSHRIDGHTMLIPNWDPLCCPLLAANLRRAGIDARVLDERPEVIRRAMRLNTGQCIPLNIIVEEFVDYVRKRELAPERCMLWMPKSELACNFNFFAPYMKSLLESYGNGMEKASVYEGDIYYLELSPSVALRAYFAYLSAGMVRRLGCRIRPYESRSGTTDLAVSTAGTLLIEAFEGTKPLGDTLSKVASLFGALPKSSEESHRPKVALFGDLYVRDNEVFNHNLIKTIEAAGGEAITTPYNEYLKIIGRAYFSRWIRDRHYKTLAEYRALLAVVEAIEGRFAGILDGYSLPRLKDISPNPKRPLEDFHLHLDQEGESFDNVLKIVHLLEAHPDISLFVQASPAFCCPSLVTEAMSTTIQRVTGVPVVTITYDGTEDIKNDLVIPYLTRSIG